MAAANRHWDAEDAARKARDAQVAAGFPDQENPKLIEEPPCQETGKRFSRLSAPGVAKIAIEKIEKAVLSPDGLHPFAVLDLVDIARAATQALHRVWDSNTDWQGPRAILREVFNSDQGFPCFRFIDEESSLAKAQEAMHNGLRYGDYVRPLHDDNGIWGLMEILLFPQVGRDIPKENFTRREWVKLVLDLCRRKIDDQSDPKAQAKVKEVLNLDSHAEKARRKKRATAKRRRDAALAGVDDRTLAIRDELRATVTGRGGSGSPAAGKGVRDAIESEYQRKLAKINATPPTPGRERDAWKKLESRLLTFAEQCVPVSN